MNSLIQNVKTLVLEAKEDHFKNTRFVPASAWLEKSLVRLQLECQALLLEVACNQKIAQSQLEIVSVLPQIVNNFLLTPDRCTILWPSVIIKTI